MAESAWENLDQVFDKFEVEVKDIVRGLTVEIFNKIVERTPQFYGRMAASWSYSLNSPNYVDRSYAVDTDAADRDSTRWDSNEMFRGYMKGHPVAVQIAKAENLRKDWGFKLGDVVWIANGVNHGEGPYAAAVESGEINLRAVNRPGNAVGRTLDWVRSNYGQDMKPRSAARLREITIGYS